MQKHKYTHTHTHIHSYTHTVVNHNHKIQYSVTMQTVHCHKANLMLISICINSTANLTLVSFYRFLSLI